jgi:hypothetical protein
LLFCFTRKNPFVLWDKAQTKEKYDGYFEEDLEYERNGWAGHRDCNDRTGYRSGHLGPGEIVPAVERVRRATETGTRIDI